MVRKELQEATRDCTIHLSKRYQDKKGKHLAPRTIREIRQFATREMLTKVYILIFHYSFVGCQSRYCSKQVHLVSWCQKCTKES